MNIKEIKIKPVPAQVSEEVLKQHLKKYCSKVIEKGAVDAKVIPAEMVLVDERARLKCMIGRCFDYGKCVNCPPNTPEPDFIRKAFSKYHWAIIFRSDVPVLDYVKGDKSIVGKHNRHTFDLCAAIESMAFHDGYYFAMGFGCGSCREAFCDGLYCEALVSGKCRFPLRSRPSMEAVGIDVYGLAAQVGWKMYPLHRSVDPETVPCASSVGLTFIY
jgi:predicted metal-binding protein